MRMFAAMGATILLSGCATASPTTDAVSAFMGRAEMCAHFSGEEAYDAERGAQIERSLRELRCSTLQRDGEALKISRRDRPEDLRRIEDALGLFA